VSTKKTPQKIITKCCYENDSLIASHVSKSIVERVSLTSVRYDIKFALDNCRFNLANNFLETYV